MSQIHLLAISLSM